MINVSGAQNLCPLSANSLVHCSKQLGSSFLKGGRPFWCLKAEFGKTPP